MACCFLLYYYRNEYNDPLDTLRFYAQQRTSNEKVQWRSSCSIEDGFFFQGVTIPSQRRYVEYFGHLLNSQQLTYTPKQILFTGLLITYEQNQILHSSAWDISSTEGRRRRSSSLDLSYTVKLADHRIQYQSFEIPLDRDSTIRRDLPPNYSVLHATHKHFIPPSNQPCQIPLEEDVLIEIFVTKTKRGKPVNRNLKSHRWFSLSLFLGKIMSSLV